MISEVEFLDEDTIHIGTKIDYKTTLQKTLCETRWKYNDDFVNCHRMLDSVSDRNKSDIELNLDNEVHLQIIKTSLMYCNPLTCETDSCSPPHVWHYLSSHIHMSCASYYLTFHHTCPFNTLSINKLPS